MEESRFTEATKMNSSQRCKTHGSYKVTRVHQDKTSKVTKKYQEVQRLRNSKPVHKFKDYTTYAYCNVPKFKGPTSAKLEKCGKSDTYKNFTDISTATEVIHVATAQKVAQGTHQSLRSRLSKVPEVQKLQKSQKSRKLPKLQKLKHSNAQMLPRYFSIVAPRATLREVASATPLTIVARSQITRLNNHRSQQLRKRCDSYGSNKTSKVANVKVHEFKSSNTEKRKEATQE